MSREIFGIAMTLFYYYSYLKSFKEFDRTDISVGCVFLACKIDFNFLKFDEVMFLFDSVFKKKRTHAPDLLKFEIEIMNFLDFEINIETPYRYIYYYLDRNKPNLLKDHEFKNFVFNLINDSYRKPLCIFWHPRYIALASLYYAFEYWNITVSYDEILIYDKTVNSDMLTLLLDHFIQILEQRIN
jgi:hypothetical protein